MNISEGCCLVLLGLLFFGLLVLPVVPLQTKLAFVIEVTTRTHAAWCRILTVRNLRIFALARTIRIMTEQT